jgi:Nitrile hydratase beta subunit, C-terminal
MEWASHFGMFKRSVAIQAVSARYALGDRVRVRRDSPDDDSSTPHYVRGKTGVIEHVHRTFTNRKDLTSARDRPSPQPHYQMRLAASDVWPESPGASGETLAIDIGEDSLETAPERAQ